MSLTIIEGSILDFEGDAIVNAANSFLNHGAGLARVIERAALDDGWNQDTFTGDPDKRTATQRWRLDHQRAPLVATGNVTVTSAGVLPYEGIIHAVGPVWNGGAFYERQLLASAYAEAVAVAVQRGWQRVAFPALSVGIFGFPPSLAAHIAVTILAAAPIDASLYIFHPDTVKQVLLSGMFRLALQMQEGSR